MKEHCTTAAGRGSRVEEEAFGLRTAEGVSGHEGPVWHFGQGGEERP